MKFCCLGR